MVMEPFRVVSMVASSTGAAKAAGIQLRHSTAAMQRERILDRDFFKVKVPFIIDFELKIDFEIDREKNSPGGISAMKK